MRVGGRKVIALSNLVDRFRVGQDRECRNSSFVEEEEFIFEYIKAKVSVEMFGTYNNFMNE